ncbi:hypothetical protein SLNWT_3979 [Streptomyces albus]|uniref:Trm112 family protein n=1 Tax=Streptomyces albus (strain ATCC 21838 / DSM 41398 / FERM P-419 / JCM 4703 / NBRC 107858) TaxID=1081613 RepID=A0A0B5EYG6_STRA4|nr:hypothetical protein SLNWT_3979 [Streptomyces albus]AOU78663.1 hypothetical protein SLNHY_3972 [Streptomyces albus]AYN34404.1 hypothetical protein DUI70_3904 [Streptomyces albus]
MTTTPRTPEPSNSPPLQLSSDDPLLLLLACPLDKGPLHLLTPTPGAPDPLVPEQALYNPRLRRRYPVRDGVPHLLPAAGEQVGAEEHARLLRRIAP